jgi:hypothetical protein
VITPAVHFIAEGEARLKNEAEEEKQCEQDIGRAEQEKQRRCDEQLFPDNL